MSFDAFMQGGGWAVFALVSAAFSAVIYLINQYLRQPGYLLVFWMRVLATVALTPLMLLVEWPDNPQFYLVVGATVLLVTFADIRSFDVAARYGGGVTSRLQPLSVWGAFLVWLLLDPTAVGRYMAAPVNTLGILAALTGCVYFAVRMNRSPLNRAAFTEMVPALLAYAVTYALNKHAMSLGPMHGAVYGYMYVQSALMAVTAGGYALLRLGKPAAALSVPAPDDVPRWSALPLATLIMTAAWIGGMIYKNYAMVFTANPSYVAAIGLTAPVFIALWYWWRQHQEQEEVWSGYGIVACALVLVILTV